MRTFTARVLGIAFGAGLFIWACSPGRSKWLVIGAAVVIGMLLVLRIAGATWADWLTPWWRRVLILAAAVGGAVASVVLLPCWSAALVIAGTAWVVTSVAYLSIPIFSARLIGISTFGGFLLLGCAPGWWRCIGLGGALSILILVLLRITGSRKADVVAADRTAVPVLSDDGNRLVDSIDAIWGSTRPHGPRCGLRAVHTHGSLAEGTWRASGVELINRYAMSDVGLFAANRGGRVVARFSNFGGELQRDDRRRAPHGLALRLESDQARHESIDLVLVDIDRFPTATREDFVSFTQAFAQRGLRRLSRMAWLILTGRSSVLALWALINTKTSSYATRTYQGLNTFYWRTQCTHEGHEATKCEHQHRDPVRYIATPLKAVRPARRVGRSAHVALDHELRARLADGGARFTIALEVGSSWRGRWYSSTRLNNAMVPWPKRRTPAVCTVELTTYAGEQDPDNGFDPLRLPTGIEPSDDEILRARAAAYPTSYLRRWPMSQETATVR